MLLFCVAFSSYYVLELSNGLENLEKVNKDVVQYLYGMYLLIASCP